MNQVKVLAIGDQHFKVDNINETEIFIKIIVDIINKNKPDFVVLLGDLLHTHEKIHTTPLKMAYDFINKIRELTHVFVLVGNHDMINNSQFLNNNHWLNFLKEWDNVTVVDKVIVDEVNDMKFIFTPYVFPGKFQEALDTVGDDWFDAYCIFAHQEFFGCKMGAILSVDGDKWDISNPHIVSGHVHEKQKLQENIYYTGSSLETSYGDNENNTIALLSFQEGTEGYDLQEIELKLPKKKIIYTTVEDVCDDDIKIEKNDDKYKISISGTYEEFKSFKKSKKYKELISQGVKIVFKPKKIETQIKNEKIKENIEELSTNSFTKILETLILQEGDSYLKESYELVFNNRQIDTDDVIYI